MVPKEIIEAYIPLWMRNTLVLSSTISELQYAYLQRLKPTAEFLILRALEASQHSKSYRPFPVGCAVVGMGVHALSAMRVFTGHNMKVHSEARVTCGEVIAIGSALQQRAKFIPLIAVVGNPQEDHGSGRIHPTLHPCHRCRDEFASLDCIGPDTIIITTTITAATQMQQEARQVFGRLTERHDERTGFSYYEPLTLTDDQEPSIWLDDLVADNTAEVLTVQQLLSLHNHQSCNTMRP